MPATIDGSPTHVLIVHIVVVLLPVSVLAALVLVAIPRSRRAFGLLSVGVALVACVAVPLAFASGGALRGRVPPSPLIDRHVSLAHELLPVAAVFGVCLAGFVAVDLLRRTSGEHLNVVEATVMARLPAVRGYAHRHQLRVAQQGAAVLLVVAALVTLVTVVRVGDSGAKAAWHGRLHTAVRR